MAALPLGGSFVTCGYCKAVPRPLSASIVAGRRAGLVSRGRIIAHLAIPASEGYGLRLTCARLLRSAVWTICTISERFR
jgi:hypothetical protein